MTANYRSWQRSYRAGGPQPLSTSKPDKLKNNTWVCGYVRNCAAAFPWIHDTCKNRRERLEVWYHWPKAHGYVFEVRQETFGSGDQSPQSHGQKEPLSCCVDPRTSTYTLPKYGYSFIYRYIPTRLENPVAANCALAIRGHKSLYTRNGKN